MPLNVPEEIKRAAKQVFIELSSKSERLNLRRGREPGWLDQYLADDATGSLRAILPGFGTRRGLPHERAGARDC
ncbi:hypothetical protein [Streptomyces sp. IGB124]|uniref:hypothetical protein n=1 Tax=Streptomyces sp. IGB124 TaxID=1519485 RepID=UPI00099BB62A|nr:hypothetical protein [Streptomyces sp. IGB124]